MKNLKKIQIKYGYTVIPVSYYEPVPDLTKVNMDDISDSHIILKLDIKYKFSFIENNLKKILDKNMIPIFLEENPMFPVADMAAYASIIEFYKPEKIIEIGSGYSAYFARIFIDYLCLKTKLIAIEPYPNKYLLELFAENKISLRQMLVQDITRNEIEEIKALKENDILFIDTSHASSMNSDVNFIFINILPMIKKNVILHFHDIFLPYDYERFTYYKLGKLYNEQYLLASILANSDYFTCLYSSFYTFKTEETPFLKITDCQKEKPVKMRRGGSLWLQKVK